MGTKVTGARTDIYQEEVDYRSALSENLMTKLAAGINFINSNMLQTFNFRFLGTFASLSTGEDGVLVFPYAVTLVGYSGHIRVAPSSSAFTIDLHKLNTSGADQGTVMASAIEVTNSAADNVVWYKNQLASTSNDPTGVGSSGGGATLPAINTTSFSAGEALRVDIMSATLAMGAADLSFNVWVIPA